jgi:hypothetical protein
MGAGEIHGFCAAGLADIPIRLTTTGVFYFDNARALVCHQLGRCGAWQEQREIQAGKAFKFHGTINSVGLLVNIVGFCPD